MNSDGESVVQNGVRELLRERYLQERDKRLCSEGTAQYVKLDPEYLRDPFTPHTERHAVSSFPDDPLDLADAPLLTQRGF